MNIEKNILDLDYNTWLNWFNIIALFIGTSYITVIIGTLKSETIEWNAFKILSTALFALLLIIFIWLLFYSKLKNIKKSIRNLGFVNVKKVNEFEVLRGASSFIKEGELRDELN